MAVYAAFRRPPIREPKRVSDVVPWRAMLAPNVVGQKYRQGLQRTYAMRGPDVEGETPEVQGAAMLRANQVLKRLGGRWMIQSEAQRTPVQTLPPVDWAHPVAALLDAERREQLLIHPGSRETTYYLTLTWYPPATRTTQGLGLFLHRPPRPAVDGRDEGTSVQEFLSHADYLVGLLRGMLAVGRPLTTAETLTYLHSCVSTRWYPLRTLGTYTDIDAQLCDTPWWGGWYPYLGHDPEQPGPHGWHIRTCSVTAYPATSTVGVIRLLDSAEVDYRWCTRWIGLEKHIQAGILRKRQGAWLGQEKGIGADMAEHLSGRQSRILNTDATNKAEEVDTARQELGAGIVAYGDFSSTVTVWDTDPQRAEAKLEVVRAAFESQEFVTTIDRETATPAWLSTHPGNYRDHVRRSYQHSLTLAHLCPGLTAIWPGPTQDAYLHAGPWFYAQTEGNTLFRVVNHIRDVGHFLSLGSTGSGKSTLANFLRLQWLQYAHSQCKVFDLDRTGRLLTYLLGGSWYDLGSPDVRFQPLRHVDAPLERGMALQWVLDLLADYHVPLTAALQAYVGSNLRKLAAYPLHERTLSRVVGLMADQSRGTELQAKAGRIDAQGISHPDTDLRALVQQQIEVRTVLKRFTIDGEFGGIFDGNAEVFDQHPIQTFELRSLLQRPRLIGPVLRYVLQQVELQMHTARPMLLLLDDAAIPLAVGQMQAQSTEWLMTTRKKAVSLGFFTHSLSQVFGSPLGTLLEEGCPTRFFLPMPSALEPAIMEIYHRLGLHETAIRTIATARPQRDVYYFCRETGQRLFHLPLGVRALNALARNDNADHDLIDTLLEREGPEDFAVAWYRHLGDAAAADWLAQAVRRTTQKERHDGTGTARESLRGPLGGGASAEHGQAWDTLAGAGADGAGAAVGAGEDDLGSTGGP